ncbi:MAG: hypothetical protein AAF431_16180 [Pseudomonadota bacterium]
MNSTSLSTRQFLIIAIGSAVFLRLLLMPFFAHVDLFSEYRRIFYAIDNDLILANSHRVVTYYIEMFFAGLTKLLVPIADTTFYLADPQKSTSSLQDYFLFLQDPYIYRYLFLFKLPYLLFDLAVAGIIWRFVDSPNLKRIALLLWLFNPLTLFATYIFGRFEVIGIFFLALSAYQLKLHRVWMASIWFGIALHCREINLLFTPFLLIAIIDFKDHFIKNLLVVAGCAATTGVLFLFPDWFLAKFGDINLFVDPDVNHTSGTINKLFSLGYYWFFPVVFGLAALAIYTWETGNPAGANAGHAERYVVAAAISMFVYFAFNVHSVHYAAWLVIFPILSIQFGRKVVLPFLVLFGVWVLLWLLKTDGGVFTPFLAAPLSMEFVNTGHFPTYFMRELATEDISLHRSIQIMRTLFAVAMAFFCYRLLKRSAAS